MGVAGIRRAALADIEALARIHVDVWRSAYQAILPFEVLATLSYAEREEQWRAWLGESESPHHVFCALENDAVVGFASGGTNRTAPEHANVPGELSSLYVSDTAQRLGHGTRLLHAITDDLRSRALVPFVLWVLAANTTAIRFYRKHGGREIARIPAVIRGADVIECGYLFSEA